MEIVFYAEPKCDFKTWDKSAKGDDFDDEEEDEAL